MAIRYRHRPDPDLLPNAAQSEGEVQSMAELEALVLLGSVGPGDEVALDGKRFKKAKRIAELAPALEQRYGEPTSVLAKVLLLGGAALAALIVIAVVLSLASTLLKTAAVIALIAGAVWLWRQLSGPDKSAARRDE
ncbi:MAG: hypothetical protein ACYC8T_13070 [Myxococcaceae bacterium]